MHRNHGDGGLTMEEDFQLLGGGWGDVPKPWVFKGHPLW